MHERLNYRIKLLSSYVFFGFAAGLGADVNGADPRLTGAPGDSQLACTQCHSGARLNGGAAASR